MRSIVNLMVCCPKGSLLFKLGMKVWITQESADMRKPVDICPGCGTRNLIAVCRTTVEYAVANEQGGQSWARREVDDDDSKPMHFRCDSCGVEFPEFALDAEGFLMGLTPVSDEGGEDTPTTDVERAAEVAGRRGLVSPDMEGPDEDTDADEMVIIVRISRGLVVDVGARHRDLPGLKVLVHDDDCEIGQQLDIPDLSALEDWPAGADDVLARCKSELPDDIISDLGIPDPVFHDHGERDDG